MVCLTNQVILEHNKWSKTFFPKYKYCSLLNEQMSRFSLFYVLFVSEDNLYRF